MEQVQAELVKLISVILCGAIGVLSVYVTIFFKKLSSKAMAQTELLKDEGARVLLKNAIDDVDELIATNIVKMENTLVKEIKEAAEDGKVDKNELKQVAVAVKGDVLDQIGSQTENILLGNIQNLDSYVEARIEYILTNLKQNLTI